jgi:hypothetical protein
MRITPAAPDRANRRAFRLLHALLVDSVAEALARSRPAGELCRWPAAYCHSTHSSRTL